MEKMEIKLSTIEFILKFIPIFFLLCTEDVCLFASGAGNKVICKENERETLLSFKQGLIDHDGALSSWGSEEHNKECCKWWGVLCSNTTGHVIGLRASGFYFAGHFAGEISQNLTELRHLKYLDLSGNDFGEIKIPEFIGLFKNLEYLNLQSSNFSGDVPYQLGNLTNLRFLYLGENYYLTSEGLNWLSNLSSLSVLDLSYNQFSGPFPDLKAFSLLNELRINDNRLTKLPTSIGQHSQLEILRASRNSLEGTITEMHFSKLYNLKLLELSFNSLALNLTQNWVPPFQLHAIRLAGCYVGPSFPTWPQTQSNLNELDLSGTGILDEAPTWLWNLSKITFLNLSYNKISGSIPDLSSNFIGFPEIDISSNNFSGPLPLFHPNSYVLQLSKNMFSGSIQSICRVKYNQLRVLDLSNNQFSGELPDCWENMNQLHVLNFAENKFSGYLPQNFGYLIPLKTLHFRNNHLTGELPSTLKTCENLELIDAGGNELTGNIPTWMGMLTWITFLSFRQNNFYGSIPLEICRLWRIQVRALSHNNLSGRIPQCFQNFTSLVQDSKLTKTAISPRREFDGYVDNAIVQWKREESEYKNTLRLLKLIDISYNKLVGDIPHEISLLSGLASLNLSRNYLTGNLISDIGQMKTLECLDLSRNNLSGEIPISLAELHYLAILDLSSNNLSGKIPQGTQLQSFDASAYAGNKELCGRPLPNCPGDNDPGPSVASRGNQVDNDDPKDEGFNMIQSLIEEYFISAVLGYIVGFWGVIGPLLFFGSWRNTYFGYLSKIGDWLYVPATICTTRLRCMKSRI